MAAVITMGSMLSVPGFSANKGKACDWGLVNVSVCNMRVSGDYPAGMATQGLLGMPVHILEDGDWLHVETPEGYKSWVHARSIHKLTREGLNDWNNSPLLVVTSMYATVYSQPVRSSIPVSDVVASDRLLYLGKRGNYFKVEYPDGRIGYLPRIDGQELTEWRKKLRNDTESILKTAKSMTGLPYMWGGMSTKGVDCSGFVRATLLQHDIIIPRDASQMARKGQHIDIAPDFSNLLPGDLLFFGSKGSMTDSATVHHVAFYLGDKKFIHSLGMVRTASFDPKAPDYDEYDHKRLLWAQRILPFINKVPELFTTDKSYFYK